MLRYVDHAIIGVTDLATAADDYEHLLLFAVSPGGTHPHMGTHNRLVVLDPEYIELIACLPGNGPMGASPIVMALARRAPGTIGFALASDDVEGDVAAMRERGVPVSGPHAGRLDGPGGTGRGWRMAYVDEDADLGVEAWRLPFLIQHDNSGAERRERLAAPEPVRPHPNGALSLAHVTVAVRDLRVGVTAYTRAFGLSAGVEGEDPMLRARTTRLELPHGAVVLAAPMNGDGPLRHGLDAQGEGLYSVTVAVDDLQAFVDRARGNGAGVRVEEPEGALVAARPDLRSSHGARLEFVQRRESA